MKLNTQTRDVSRHGVGHESTFKIAANAQAFDILSSKLYTDPKLAIVRELSTNAYDAMVEAGTQDKPFKVHLPNSFESYFSIRDFGTGLSPEAVETIYTTYFSSTRNDSNEYTGALGLGSKSPFSYTEQFTVTSYYKGRVYTYSAFKNENGSPSIALMSDQLTTEPNGVEVRINIEDGDSWDFEQAARKVYRFFPVRPEFTGRKIDFPQVEPIYFGDEFALFDKDPHTVGVPGRVNVVMGNICYAINSDKVTAYLGTSSTLVMFVPIGECQIAASREELHYDPKTIATLQTKLDAIRVDLQQRIDGELVNCKTLIERMIKLNEYRHLISLNYANVVIKTKKDNVYTLRRIDVKGDKLFLGNDRWNDDIDPNMISHFVQNDVGELTQKDKNRLRFMITSVRNGQTYDEHRPALRFWLADIQDRVGFVATFGEPVAVLSKLPDPPRNHNGTVSTTTRSFIREYSGNSRISESWTSIHLAEDATVDNTAIIAVPRRGNHAIFNGREVPASQVQNIAASMGYTKIYGITERYFAKITEELGLVDINIEAKIWITNAVNKLTTSDIARMQHGFSSYEYPDKLVNAIRGLSDVCNDLVNFVNSKNRSGEFSFLMQQYNLTVPKVPSPTDAFKRRYPLIARVDLGYADLKDVVEYIGLREAKLAAMLAANKEEEAA